MVEDYIAKGNKARCSDGSEIALGLQKAFKMFLNINVTPTNFSTSKMEFSLIIENNPLIEFVYLPPDRQNILYSNALIGGIRGALASIRIEVQAHFVQDQLRGDPTNEIRIKIVRFIEEAPCGDD
ncbi:Trafficking protein particle complex subunit 3 [Cichlidogyrus casuarinus]|uniref:Trafficking protein particle complex subunit 3 n=1 Tax=Cichlidogyrus casuarinus TaxID=1844966 RepID=A0ABD2QKQ5_9PLAT